MQRRIDAVGFTIDGERDVARRIEFQTTAMQHVEQQPAETRRIVDLGQTVRRQVRRQRAQACIEVGVVFGLRSARVLARTRSAR